MKNYGQFCKDYIDEIYRNYDLNDFKYDPNDRDLTSVLAGYISIFTTKFITDVPRNVLISSDLQSKMDNDLDLKDNVDFMIEKIKNGQNINGHLTRQIYNTTITDKLFSDWGITHIHLNKTEANTNEEMKNNREGNLLFCVFTYDTCYMLDALSHNEPNVFVLMNYLRILVNNWPGVFLAENADMVCQNPVKTDEEIIELRKANVNVIAYEIDGKQYFKTTPNGLTSAGTNINSQLLAMNMVKGLQSINDEYRSIAFNFLCNDFGDVVCEEGTYVLGFLFQKH